MFLPEVFHGKRACVLGLGRSGLACATLLNKKGYRVLISESKPTQQVRSMITKLPKGVCLETGKHTSRVLRSGFVVKSPGIPPQVPILQSIKRHGIPVFSELEVALSFCPPVKVWAVTGTNGKTTTTALLGEILDEAGWPFFIAGNIGVPLSQYVPRIRKGDSLVLEVSSYQLQDSQYFRPNVAALLNITPDHLGHHRGWAKYVEAKAKIFKFQRREDVCVFNARDKWVVQVSKRCPSRKLFFPSAGPLSRSSKIFKSLRLIGQHNVENAMAAATMASSQGIGLRPLQSALAKFRGVEHRLESWAQVRGLLCINDSKATNVDSTLVALQSLRQYPRKIFLILGGLDKGSPYYPLRPWIFKLCKAILTIGEAAGKIEDQLRGPVPIFSCRTLKEAVGCAFMLFTEGDLLLLSPACASFDQFKDFEDRGRQFKKLVKEMQRHP
ncbi:MAG: UDP-N-acetylmuramoyl-L-alanine--D-glutamate ligase [Elusimicrobia bacterium]|nr:UDP-N-acetylmuramoyl-L-alanine--D-glutamate ligase [Elusimicrobiota bacterium]